MRWTPGRHEDGQTWKLKLLISNKSFETEVTISSEQNLISLWSGQKAVSFNFHRPKSCQIMFSDGKTNIYIELQKCFSSKSNHCKIYNFIIQFDEKLLILISKKKKQPKPCKFYIRYFSFHVPLGEQLTYNLIVLLLD